MATSDLFMGINFSFMKYSSLNIRYIKQLISQLIPIQIAIGTTGSAFLGLRLLRLGGRVVYPVTEVIKVLVLESFLHPNSLRDANLNNLSNQSKPQSPKP